MRRRYAVKHGDELTVFTHRLEAAIAYWKICPGSVLVYKAHGRWGGKAERSTRWLPMPIYDACIELIKRDSYDTPHQQ